jgi:hypothetical protein
MRLAPAPKRYRYATIPRRYARIKSSNPSGKPSLSLNNTFVSVGLLLPQTCAAWLRNQSYV